MKPMIHVSNHFQTLRKQLTQRLFFTPSPPFQKKIVLLPDLKMKNELLFHFLDDVDIVMGLDFMELGSGLQFLYTHLSDKTLHLPPLDLLTLHLVPFIQKLFTSYTEKKVLSLSGALAMEFLRYGKFGGEEFQKWKEKKGWQQMLWDEVFSKWDIPSMLLETPFKQPDIPIEVHLYKFSFLPQLYYRFFEKVASYCFVHMYHFSPCKTFWTDIFSEKERLYVEKKVDSNTHEAWASYLRDRPLLLAQFGRLARQTFRLFEDADFPLEENYQSPEPHTLLCQIQHQILHFENPNKQHFFKDHSLLLHPASSKRREVEILYTTLLALDFNPSEVKIYAPDISAYAPFISLIFGAKDSPFKFSISGLSKEKEDPFLQAFSQLLALNQDRFTIDAVLRVFSYSPFQRKFHLDEKEVKLFGIWMKNAGVKWGVDRNHRQELLSGKEMLETGESGTWEDAFHHLLLSFTKIPETRSTWERPILDFSDAETFGKCVSIVRNLRKDLSLFENASFTLREWSQELYLFLNRYFEIGEKELATFKWLLEKLSLLESEALPEEQYSFFSLFHYLKSVFQETTDRKEGSLIEGLHFSSLKLSAIDHASIVCLLGLDENQFPRITNKNSLCELELKEQPTLQQQDRHLFLEILFAATSQLILSYVSINEEDGKEQAPSSIIQELLAYLDPIDITKKHPPFFFHEHYFKEPQHGSQQSFFTAKTFYFPNSESTPLIPEFLSPVALPSFGSEDLTIDLKNLSRFAKHPLRFYLNYILHLYLEYEEKDEEFTLSPLNKMLLLKQAHIDSFDEAFKKADQSGKLPLGRFKEISHLLYSEEAKVIDENLKHLNVDKQPFSLELSFSFPLNQKRSAQIEGMLCDVTDEGLLFHGEKKLSDLLKIWPLYLAFTCSQSPQKKDLLLTKKGERLTFSSVDLSQAFVSYLLYYEKALQTPSPCLPTWAMALLEKGPEALAKEIKKTTDPYALWIFHPDHYCPQVIFETWSPLLQETFKPLQEVIVK